jgi:predicted O-methyltransferase YrrM
MDHATEALEPVQRDAILSPIGKRRDFVRAVWLLALGREPEKAVLDHFSSILEDGLNPVDYLLDVASCPEAESYRQRHEGWPGLFVPPGHFYSPIVNPEELPAGLEAAPRDLPGIDMDMPAMEATFRQLAAHVPGLDFPVKATPGHRYHSDNSLYGIHDATILACMIRHRRPARIIEVGSGFSSAAILDTLDRTPELNAQVTFIEPYTDRLDLLLREADLTRTTIHRQRVQDVPLTVFDTLRGGDLMVLDTTHISKTGSDVNHAIFEVLPRLASGVAIHFHDIFAGFEYIPPWIYQENRSWNEMYLLRAFLMHNKAYRVYYANSEFAARRGEIFHTECPELAGTSGGGFWIMKN